MSPIAGIARRLVSIRGIGIGWPTTIACMVYLVLWANIGDRISEEFSILILILATLKCVFKGQTGSLDFSLTIGLFYLHVVPSITLALLGHYEFVFLTAISVILFDVFVLLSGDTIVEDRPPPPAGMKLTQADYVIWGCLIFGLFTLSALVPTGSIARHFSFSVPFACSLIIFEKFCRLASIRTIYAMIAIYFLAIAFFINVYWSGFGRIVIGSNILLPLFVAHRWRDIGLRVWPAMLVAPFAIFIANLSRQGSATLSELHSGSVAAHMVLSKRLIDEMAYTPPHGWDSYWDQWLLLFLQWVPRSLWSDKPIGAGRYYVDQSALQLLVLEGHSVALGYVGELVFFLGNGAVLGGLITFVTLLLLRRMIARITLTYAAPLLAYDVFLISFVWGGLSTFGGRMSFMVLPMVLFIFLRRFNLSSHAAGLKGGRLPSPIR